MKAIVYLLFSVVVLSAETSNGAPATCQTGAQIWDDGSNTNYACTLGNLLFNNFYVIGTTNDSMPTVSVAQPLMSADGDVLFSFNPNEAGNFDIDVYFQVTAMNGSLLDVVGLTVGGNLGSVSERVCTAPILGNPGNICTPTGVQLGSLSNTSGNATIEVPLELPVSSAFIFKDVGTQPGGSLSTVSESFETTTAAETNSGLLMLTGCALATLIKLRRRAA